MKRFITSLSFMLLVTSVTSVFGQSNIYVKITDNQGNVINGESTSSTHKNEIQAVSFGQENTGCTAQGAGGGSGSCKAIAGHFIFNMYINQSVIALNQALFNGTHLLGADIVFEKPGTNNYAYYKIHLDDVTVLHITNSIDNQTTPTVQVELNARRITWTYTPQNGNGTPGTPVSFGYDAGK